MSDQVSETIAERGKIYGDPLQSHTNIGLSWTGLIQQHYGITLDHPLPPALVAQMMVTFKMQRSAKVYHADNYVDAHAYTKFADEFQQEANDDIAAERIGVAAGLIANMSALDDMNHRTARER